MAASASASSERGQFQPRFAGRHSLAQHGAAGGVLGGVGNKSESRRAGGAWWCPSFASVFWTLTWAEEGPARPSPPNIFNSRSLAIRSDSIFTTPFSRNQCRPTLAPPGGHTG